MTSTERPQIGDEVRVSIYSDRLRDYQLVRGEVVYIGWNGGGQGKAYSIKLLEYVGFGWEVGDTYRAPIEDIYPIEGDA